METTGKVFVITGGGNGIGREVVSGLLKRGAQVAAVDRSEEGLAETARLAAAAYAGLSTHTVDITDCAVIERLPAEVHTVHGQVDGVLNVAGIVQRFARVHDLGHDEIEKVMAVNFWGVVNMVKAFVPTSASAASTPHPPGPHPPRSPEPDRLLTCNRTPERETS